MRKVELEKKVDAVKDETKSALQTLYDNLNHGQQQKIAAVPEVAELFERYGVEVVSKMDPSIVVAIVTGCLTLLGTIITVKTGNSKIEMDLSKHSAVQDEKISELTREVRLHNNFAQRVPLLEQKMEMIEKEINKIEEV